MSATPSLLPDPRQYPALLASNRLIHHAVSALDAAHDTDADLWRDSLRLALMEMLQRDDMLTLSVALTMVPSAAAYRELWLALRAAAEQGEGRKAVLFAVPLVLVAGSNAEACLPADIADVAGLNALLREHGVFAPGAEVLLGGALLHPDDVSAISAGHIYRATREAATVLDALPATLAGRAVTVHKDGVFLRYLLGVAMQEEGRPAPIRLGGAVGSWGLPVMKFLGEQLKSQGVTLFPIARPPQALMQAMVEGGKARHEVALQAFASSQIRRLRDKSLTPVAVLAAHVGGELRFTLSAESGEGADEGFVWALSPLDSVPAIEAMVRELMAECQVQDVRVPATLMPEEEAGERLFLHAANLGACVWH
ncbi:hypothetical protein [Craterilacuibacter sp.]|uniref:hypothetical protein n=1 Tax=Craterilacuibacter sp. TaxID=2870909 RepID=UPI003F3795C9